MERILLAVGLACVILAPRAWGLLKGLRATSARALVDSGDQFQRLLDAAALLRELGLDDIANDLATRAAPRLVGVVDHSQPEAAKEVVDAKAV